MNRKWFVLAGIVSVLLVFGACTSAPPLKFDENLPLEESARLYFEGLEVKEFNGIPVPIITDWQGGKHSAWYNKEVALPSCEMEFFLEAFTSTGSTYYHAKDVKFKYTFEAGKLYRLFFIPNGGPDEKTWGIKIYEIPSNNLNDLYRIDRINLIAFAPFYKDVEGDQRTGPRVLE